MLHGVFQTKEGKIVIAFMGIAVIIIGVFVFANNSQNKKFLEQAVMAENYLKAGSYEQAIKAYEVALSMKNSDEERLTIGLADAYAGISDYDKALEVLRALYKKTSGLQLKEKIEEIISDKTDYEYLQSISRAKVYFNNKEYNKAITEYEKAKQIKSKEVTAYQGIVDAYIELGEYDRAQEEALEGIEITKDKSMELTLAEVDLYINNEQYSLLLKQAEEYIYQENYKDGIAKYQEAINMKPEESEAYSQLAQVYIAQEEYEKAIQLLQDAIELIESKELKSLLSQATESKETEDKKINLLHQLYTALKKRNITEISDIMEVKFFIDEISADAPFTYTNGTLDSANEPVMVIYDSNNVYYGQLSYDMKTGKGIYIRKTGDNKTPGLYYYDGEWNNDIPNGNGITVEENLLQDEDGVKYNSKILTEGSFYYAKENGRMIKYFYINEIETGKLTYTAQNGVPKPMLSENQLTPTPETSSYVIGILMLTEKSTEEYYSVEPQTVWGVKLFIE